MHLKNAFPSILNFSLFLFCKAGTLQDVQFCFVLLMNSNFISFSQHHHGEVCLRVCMRGMQRMDQRTLAWTNCTSELTFLFALLSSLFPPPPQTTKAFLPKMLELNHGHIVTVASSLGLFSTAGIEVSMIHKGSYTSHHSHRLFFSCKAHGVPASTLGQGDLPPFP